MLSSSASSVTALRAGADLDDDGRIKKAGRSLLQQPGELNDVHPDRGVSPRAVVGGGAQGGAREHERRGAPSRHPAQVLSWAEMPSRCARMVPAGARRSRPSAPRERIRALSLVCSYVGSRATPRLLPARCSCHRVQVASCDGAQLAPEKAAAKPTAAEEPRRPRRRLGGRRRSCR